MADENGNTSFRQIRPGSDTKYSFVTPGRGSTLDDVLEANEADIVTLSDAVVYGFGFVKVDTLTLSTVSTVVLGRFYSDTDALALSDTDTIDITTNIEDTLPIADEGAIVVGVGILGVGITGIGGTFL